ncbi:MAG: acylphosphatase [Patescibacteria group bacterium]
MDVVILGRVQGVFFRRTVKHEAARRGISGFIRNEPDGTVRIEAEGNEDALKEFTEWLKGGAGEGLHEIGEVEVSEGAFKMLEGFEVVE